MSTEVRWRRGTAAQHENFIGAMSEITHDTTNHNLRIHDGMTDGGARNTDGGAARYAVRCSAAG